MIVRHSEQDYIDQESEERVITDKAIIGMIALLGNTKADIVRELRDFYNRYGTDGVVTYAEARMWSAGNSHRRRLTVLLHLVSQKFTNLNSAMTPSFRRFLLDIIDSEDDFFNVFRTEDEREALLIKKWGEDNSVWSSRLNDDVDLWTAFILADIKQNLLKKGSFDRLMKQMDKRFKSMESVIKRLGLTESTAIGSMERYQIFRQLGIKKYKFYTKEDERTCETCNALHGLVFPISAYEVGVTASPLHAHCRCWEVPIFD